MYMLIPVLASLIVLLVPIAMFLEAIKKAQRQRQNYKIKKARIELEERLFELQKKKDDILNNHHQGQDEFLTKEQQRIFNENHLRFMEESNNNLVAEIDREINNINDALNQQTMNNLNSSSDFCQHSNMDNLNNLDDINNMNDMNNMNDFMNNF